MPDKAIKEEIRNINQEIEENTTIHEKVAIWFSNKIGSMAFVYYLILFMILWSSINISLLLGGHKPFDQPYEFRVMLLISNCIQLITPLFILVSQNIQNRRDKAIADQEYIIAKKTSNETKLMFEYLKNLDSQLKIILTKTNTQQQKIISLEEKQNQFNDIISKNLMMMLKGMISQMKDRPCLLDQTVDNPELCDLLIKALGNYKQNLNTT